eukprot:scaffold1790_cov73-Phaeocystis_antarctica.AAC.6
MEGVGVPKCSVGTPSHRSVRQSGDSRALPAADAAAGAPVRGGAASGAHIGGAAELAKFGSEASPVISKVTNTVSFGKISSKSKMLQPSRSPSMIVAGSASTRPSSAAHCTLNSANESLPAAVLDPHS